MDERLVDLVREGQLGGLEVHNAGGIGGGEPKKQLLGSLCGRVTRSKFSKSVFSQRDQDGVEVKRSRSVRRRRWSGLPSSRCSVRRRLEWVGTNSSSCVGPVSTRRLHRVDVVVRVVVDLVPPVARSCVRCFGGRTLLAGLAGERHANILYQGDQTWEVGHGSLAHHRQPARSVACRSIAPPCERRP